MKRRLVLLPFLALFLSAALTLPAWADHVARVKDFPSGDGVAEFLDMFGSKGVLVDKNRPAGESTAIFVAPRFPESTVNVYKCKMNEEFEPVPDFDNQLVKGQEGFSLLFYCKVAEGMPNTIVVVTEPDGYDYYWAPAYSGVDGSLITNDEFVPWQEVSKGSEVPTEEEGYLRLAIKGTNVNLRPQPRAKGRALAQANEGTVFIAEKWVITNEEDGSEWYKIVLPAPDSGQSRLLRDWDKRFKSHSGFAFVSAKFATLAPLKKGDADKIKSAMARLFKIDKTLPLNYADNGYGKFNWDDWQLSCAMSVGAGLPEIVQKWGKTKIERRALNFIDQFVVLTDLERKDGFEVTFYEWPPLPGIVVDTLAITSLRSLYVDREGANVGGLVIGRDDKNRVRALLGAPDKEEPGGVLGESWLWGTEFNDLAVRFGKDGLVSSVMLQTRVAD